MAYVGGIYKITFADSREVPWFLIEAVAYSVYSILRG